MAKATDDDPQDIRGVIMNPRATIVPLSSVTPERVEWLWEGRMPAGKLVIVEGDPGTGKSTMTLDLAARLSAGADWPDGTPSAPSEVLLMSAEDGLADTIAPRLKAALADLSMINALTLVPLKTKDGTIQQVPPALPRDIEHVELAIREHGARLVIIDPLNAFLGGEIDSYKDQDVRRALMPLSMLAEKTRCTFILVRHLNKGDGTKAIYRGGGSIGIGAASRAEFLVDRDPDDSERRVFAPVKFNLGPKPPALAYRLINDPLYDTAYVEWEPEPVDVSADVLVGLPGSRFPKKRSPASEWLEGILAQGPLYATDIYQQGEEFGHSESQLKRAKQPLHVDTWKDNTPGGAWIWGLPEEPSFSLAETDPIDPGYPQSTLIQKDASDQFLQPGIEVNTKRVVRIRNGKRVK